MSLWCHLFGHNVTHVTKFGVTLFWCRCKVCRKAFWGSTSGHDRLLPWTINMEAEYGELVREGMKRSKGGPSWGDMKEIA